MKKLGSEWLWLGAGIAVLMVANNVNKKGVGVLLTGSDNNIATTETPPTFANEQGLNFLWNISNINPINYTISRLL